MRIEHDIEIHQVQPGSMDIRPRGESCYMPGYQYHEFFLKTQAAGFIYEICERCGTVRITERR